MNAKELAKAFHSQLDDVIVIGEIKGSAEYAYLNCEDDSGNTFMIKIIQLNADDGEEDNHEDCVHNAIDIDDD